MRYLPKRKSRFPFIFVSYCVLYLSKRKIFSNMHSCIADVEDVKFVINFDYPSNSEDYVHRIGRTGRSQRTGTAYTFFTPVNANKASDLVAVLKEAKQVINPKLQEMADSRGWSNGAGSSRGKYIFVGFKFCFS